MSRNDAQDFAQRLYARVPGHYRVYDAERGQPLLSLLTVVAAQVANVRQDLDSLWDNFFIETCDDWVVPYIGALVGTNLLAQPVGQSNRLDVWNTITWRRSKGAPQMLQALSQAISGWPTDLAEFFGTLGWSQNMNHVRLDRPLGPDLHDPLQLSLLGRGSDPFAHAADFKPAHALEQARVTANSLGIGRAPWGTAGRYQTKNLGFFVRRLQTFPVKGATPAAVPPGGATPANAACFTFNPLFREMPLFTEQSAAPLTRAAFGGAPWESFGSDVAVRQFGVLLASELDKEPSLTGSTTPFTFGGGGAGLALDPAAGMRLLEPRSFQLGAAHFVITAGWQQAGHASTVLGALSTLHAALGDGQAFQPGTAAPGSGQLVLTVQTGRAGLAWSRAPHLTASPPARFPGAILAVRAAGTGAVHSADGLYVYLPASFLTPGEVKTYYIADDGSAYTATDLHSSSLARSAEGQVYPSRVSVPSTTPADAFALLNRGPGGLRLTDPARFGGAGVLVEVDLFTGTFQTLGAVATISQTATNYPQLQVPNPWPAFTYGPSKSALAGTLPSQGLLSVLLKPLAGGFVPPAELIVVNRAGQSLLVYLPELTNVPAQGTRLFIADDGSTYFVPADQVAQAAALSARSFGGLVQARPAQGQVLPVSGVWPLRQRRPVAINLCRCERNSLLASGELGIDPELGRFALPNSDPAIGLGGLSVDYVEAFSDRVGALNFDRQLDSRPLATRLVAQSGDADSSGTADPAGAPVHSNLADAVANARNNDVIEIADSATYGASAGIVLNNPAVQSLTIRAAAGQRPCLTFYRAANVPASACFTATTAMSHLELNGLLISGGPFLIESPVQQLQFTACTLDPLVAFPDSVISSGPSLSGSGSATYLLCRCVTGGIWLGSGFGQLIIADSIVDGHSAAARAQAGSPPAFGGPPAGITTHGTGTVQLERVTVLGRISCNVLNASESLLNDLAFVQDQQSGCVRFTRFERGSVLPRRYQCVPSDDQTTTCALPWRCLAPVFNSLFFGRPDYAQLAGASPTEIMVASEAGAEVGAFAGVLNTIRLSNLNAKLQEFMPVGLSAVVIGET